MQCSFIITSPVPAGLSVMVHLKQNMHAWISHPERLVACTVSLPFTIPTVQCTISAFVYKSYLHYFYSYHVCSTPPPTPTPTLHFKKTKTLALGPVSIEVRSPVGGWEKPSVGVAPDNAEGAVSQPTPGDGKL